MHDGEKRGIVALSAAARSSNQILERFLESIKSDVTKRGALAYIHAYMRRWNFYEDKTTKQEGKNNTNKKNSAANDDGGNNNNNTDLVYRYDWLLLNNNNTAKWVDNAELPK